MGKDKFKIVLRRFALTASLAAAFLQPCTASALTFYSGVPSVVVVVPKTAPAGTPRTIVVTGTTCPSAFSIDETTPGVLALRSLPGLTCPAGVVPTAIIPYTPTVPGNIRVTLMFSGSSDVVAETVMATNSNPRAKSSSNIAGMWFDTRTNGSGISFHHNSANDQAFGTWFMYGVGTPESRGIGRSRWFSLQGLRWIDGNTVEGVVLEVAGQTNECLVTNSCPRSANGVGASGVVRFTLTEASRGKIEIFDLFGVSLFSSDVARLQF